MTRFLFFTLTSFVMITALPAEGTDWHSYRFGYKYLTHDPERSSPPGPCVELTPEDIAKITNCLREEPSKTCPKCPVDRDIRRCRFDDQYSINIFPDKGKCETSRYDATE